MKEETRATVTALNISLLHIETQSKALALTVKHQLHHSESQSNFITDMKNAGAEYREDTEIMLEFLLNSLTLLNDNLSTQINIISDL